MKFMYYRYNPVHSFYDDMIEQLQYMQSSKYKRKMFKSNVCEYDELIETISYFSDNLKDFHRDFKNKQNVEGANIKILIPYQVINNIEKIDKSKHSKNNSLSGYNKLINKLIKAFKPQNINLPYFAFLNKEGKGVYLTIIYVDREYYSKARKFNIKAQRDMYFTEEGKLCKKDTPNAILKYKKGEFTGKVKESNFSLTKVDGFWTGCADRLEYIRENFLNKLDSIFKEFLPKYKDEKNYMKKRQLTPSVSKKNGVKVFLKKIQINHNKLYFWLYRKNLAINTFINFINKVYKQIGANFLKSSDDYNQEIDDLLKQRLNCFEFEQQILKKIQDIRKEILITGGLKV